MRLKFFIKLFFYKCYCNIVAITLVLTTFATSLHLAILRMNITAPRTDNIGILASTLCMIHCLATPFLFIAKSCSASCCEASPNWWSSLDFIFLIVSFFAIYQSNKNSSKTYIKYALWVSWTVLFAVLLNEKFQIIALVESAIYIPAILLVFLHIYNLKYCQCKTENCCTKKNR